MLVVKMHLEDKEGKALVDHYKIKGFPSIVFVDKDSLEIDRIIGYRPPDEFLEELKRIQSGEGTIPNLIDRTTQDPNNVELWMALAEKYEDRGDLGSTLETWESISEAKIGEAQLTDYKIIELKSRINSDVTELQNYVINNLDSEYTSQAFRNIITIQRYSKDKEGEGASWLKYLNYIELKELGSAQFYNSFAWRMSELEQNLELALNKIRLGITMVAMDDSSTQAGYKDTKAEILWKMGRTEEAIKVIDECIKLQPDDQYFKDQRDKFLSSK